MSDKFGVCMICRFCKWTNVHVDRYIPKETWCGGTKWLKLPEVKTGHKCIIKDKIIEENSISLVRLCKDFERQK